MNDKDYLKILLEIQPSWFFRQYIKAMKAFNKKAKGKYYPVPVVYK